MPPLPDLSRLPEKAQDLLTYANACLEHLRREGWTREDVVAQMAEVADGDIEAVRLARAASLAIYSREGTPEERELEDQVRASVAEMFGVDWDSDEVDRRQMDEILAWTEAALGATGSA